MTVSRNPYFFWLVAAALLLALLYFFVFPHYGQYFPKCFFYTFTGLYCPGCGSQRALAALLHGQVLTALHDNLLAVIALPFLLHSTLAPLFRPNEKGNRADTLFYSPLFVRIVLIAVILFAVLRNIPGTPFTLLAPL